MRIAGACIALAMTVMGPVPARAVIGALDNTPAATILVPYFEVDLANESGMTTLVGLQNASATAMLVSWTLWTDYGLATHSFDTYLTGYDTLAVNLRDVFQGSLPRTASDGQDPQDTISPQGNFSQDINFASCNAPEAQLPPAVPAITGQAVTDLQAAHRGLESPTYFGAGKCGGRNYGDQVVRGYVTIDTVNHCSLTLRPDDAGYWGFGRATEQNALLADYFFVDPANNFMDADIAVHVEASLADPLVTTAGNYTFYGGLASVNGQAIDHREPLGTLWFASYDAGSELLVWRDPARNTAVFNCGAIPQGFPMSQNQVLAFDMESDGEALTSGEPFPSRANRVRIGPGADVPASKKGGVAYLNLNTLIGGQRFGMTKQSWVSVRRSPENNGRFSAAWSAIPVGRAASPSDTVLVPVP